MASTSSEEDNGMLANIPILKPHLPPTPTSVSKKRVISMDVGPSKIRKLDQLLVSEKTRLVPSTPKFNLVSEDKIDKWNKTPRRNPFWESDDEELEPHELGNPFIESSLSKPRLFKNKATVDYENYNEFVNKQGKKIKVQLTDSQKQIKPRRLFSSDLKIMKTRKEFKIFNDKK